MSDQAGMVLDFTLKVERSPDGSYCITSSVPGLLLHGHDLWTLLNDVPIAVKALRRLNGDERHASSSEEKPGE